MFIRNSGRKLPPVRVMVVELRTAIISIITVNENNTTNNELIIVILYHYY